MAFKVQIQDNIREAFHSFDQLKRSEIKNAARRAISRTLTTLRKESVITIKKELRISSSLLKNKYIFIDRVSGKRLNEIQGSVVYQSRGLNLIDFVKGTKAVTPQKGVKVKRRKKVRVEITPGKRFIVAGGFITQTASKGLQVMKRDSKVNGHLLMQTGPSLGALLLNEKKRVGARLQAQGLEIFNKNFQHELKFRLNKMLNSVNK